MKKLLLLLVPLVVLGAVGGAVWWKYGRQRDPFAVAQKLMDEGNLVGAQLELRNAVRSNPNNAAAHFRLGQVAQRLGDPVAAEKELKQARELGFEARLVNPIMAQSFMAQGKYRELVRDFSAQGLPPDQAGPLLVLRALAQLSLGDTTAAVATAADAERIGPQSAEAALASARIQLALRDFAAAEAKVDRALQISPRNAEAMVLKGQLQNVKGDRTRAVETFDSVLQFNPGNLVARLERANILLMDGKDDRARTDVEAALKVQPRSSMGLYLRAVLAIKAEDYAAADADLTKIQSLLPRFPRGLFFLAIAKYNLGQAEQASDAANKYLAKNAADPDAIKLFARIELAGRRTAGVIKVLQRVQEGGVADADMLDLLSRAYALAGKPDLAMQNLERAAALAPQNADILTRLASLRLAMGDSGRAAGEFEKALALSPSQAEAGEQLVLAALSSGEIDRASLALDRLRKVQGESETVGNLAALIRMAQLDIDGAQFQLEKTIKAYPDAVQARLNLARVLLLKDKAGDAQKVLGEVLAKNPAQAGALSTLTNLLLGEGKAEDAVALMEKAHASVPKDTDITVGLANLYGRQNATRKALALVDEMLKDQPGNTVLLVSRARTLANLGENAEAQTAYRRTLEENPLDVYSRRALAGLQVAAKDEAGAKATLNEGLKAEPGSTELMQALVAVVLRAEGLDPALAMADQLARDPANLPAARWLRGDVLMAAGRFIDAIPVFGAELRSEPSTTGVLRLATALNSSGRADQATVLLRDWMTKNPTDAAAAESLGSLDLVARRFFDAERSLQVVLSQRPSDPAALNNLAWVYQQRNDSRAQTVAQKSYLLNPTAEAADTLGWILVTSGNPTTGVALLRQARAQLPRDPTVTYHLAVALKDTGKTDDAAKLLGPIVNGLQNFDDRAAAARLLAELAQTK